jgi:inosine/xanthosine triphosphate pyrophosphatase family protein
MKLLCKEKDYYKNLLMKKIYFATSNKSKIERMQLLCNSIAEDFIVESVPNIMEVEENG